MDNRSKIRNAYGESKTNSQARLPPEKRTASPVVDVPFTYEPVKVPPLRYGPLRGGYADPDSLSVSGPFCSTPVWQNAPIRGAFPNKKPSKKGKILGWLLFAIFYARVQVADELEVSRHMLWRALSQGDDK